MITKVTGSNRDEDSALFQEINQDFENQNIPIVINTLAEYFAFIEDIVDLDKKQYFILPLDEEPFDINANTRNILVPTAFKQNGVGVEGEHLAENLFFRIDRYYDIQDLASSRINIIIQWELPGTKTKGISTPWVRDIESQPGKLIFGWTLPKELTTVAGNIRFSVRFYELNVDGSIKYNFNTLPQSIKINSSLNYNVNDNTGYVVDSTDADVILNRLSNSNIGGVVVDKPVFYLELPEELTADMVLTDEHPEAILSVSAYPATGEFTEVEYTWYKDANQVANTVASNYIESSDTAVLDGKIYYKFENDEYSSLTTEEANVVLNTEGGKLYEKVSQFAATEAGIYKAKAIAKLETSDESGRKPTAYSPETYSKSWVFEYPQLFDLGSNNFNSNTKIITDATNPIIKISYPVGQGQQRYAIYEHVLYRGATEAAINNIVISEDGTVSGLENVEIVEGTGNEYEIIAEGYYVAIITKTLNKVSRKAKTQTLWITHQAEAPQLELITEHISMLGSTISVKVSDVNKNYSYKYQWQTSSDNSADSEWTKITDAHLDASNVTSYKPTKSGYYRLAVNVEYNGDIETAYSIVTTIFDKP